MYPVKNDKEQAYNVYKKGVTESMIALVAKKQEKRKMLHTTQI